MDVSERQLSYALAVARKCELAATAFGARSKKREFIKNASSACELLFALTALAANLPIIKSFVGNNASDYVGVVSCALLIATVLIDRLYSKDPPERLQDYALYMRLFSGKILQNVNDQQTDNTRAALGVLLMT
jgi:hypothetical protein